MGTVWPSKGHGRQRTYNLNYGVSEFIWNFKEYGPDTNEQHSIFTRLSNKIDLDYATFDQGRLKIVLEDYFVNIFRNEMVKKRDIYKDMKYWPCGSLFANLRVGRPLEADIAFEIILDKDLLRVEYLKCLDINSKETNEEGTHLFCILTKDPKWLKWKDINDISPEPYMKIRADVILENFQEDVKACGEEIERELADQLEKDGLKEKLTMIGFKMHRRGVCAVLKYKGPNESEGLLIDLVPMLRLPHLYHPKYPSKLLYEVHKPRYQADRYRETMKCEQDCFKTDLFLLNELDKPYNQLDGDWSLSTSSIDHELLKLLSEKVKGAFRVVKFILQMYIVENRQEITMDFVQIGQVFQNN